MLNVGDVVLFNNEQYKIKGRFDLDGEVRYIISTPDNRSDIISISHKNVTLDETHYRREKLNKILSKL